MAERAPSFQFYPKDFLTDERVRLMSYAERGIYITLLCHCWLEGSLPSDAKLLTKLLHLRPYRFARLWTKTCHIVSKLARTEDCTTNGSTRKG
jgi:hypothetical protein